MTKAKYLIMIVLVDLMLFITSTIVNATNTEITATKVVDNFNGNIDFKLSNISLSSEGQYVWSIGTTSSSSDITKWYPLGDFNESAKTATISLVRSESYILDILRKTNNTWIFIKDNTANTMIIDGLKVDLTLPPYNAFTLSEYYGSYYILGGEVSGGLGHYNPATYDIGNVYYSFKKVTDTTLINNYQKALINGTSVSDVFNISVSDIENVLEWNLCRNSYKYNNQIPKDKIPPDNGIYILYLKAKDVDSKIVYGYKIIGSDQEAPTVTKIEVTSPTSGTYKTSQTVKIKVIFNETITGTAVPTLKIKFGNSAERSLTNGTMKENYIEYSYNIQDSDNGQLTTVSLLGGTIKDAYNNEAQLSCPIISGYIIKANTEGITTNNTDNQDKTNNNGTDNSNNGSTNNGGTDNSNNGSTNNSRTTNNESSSSTVGKKDDTIATGKLPQTGIGVGLISTIVVLIGGSIFAYTKYSKLKGV